MRVGVAAFFGGAPDDKPEQYEASSPITSVASVRVPVFVIQGSMIAVRQRNLQKNTRGRCKRQASALTCIGMRRDIWEDCCR